MDRTQSVCIRITTAVIIVLTAIPGIGHELIGSALGWSPFGAPAGLTFQEFIEAIPSSIIGILAAILLLRWLANKWMHAGQSVTSTILLIMVISLFSGMIGFSITGLFVNIIIKLFDWGNQDTGWIELLSRYGILLMLSIIPALVASTLAAFISAIYLKYQSTHQPYTNTNGS